MKKFLVVLAIAFFSALCGVGLHLFPGFPSIALSTVDFQFRLFADRSATDKRIVLIEVDQESLDHFEKDNIPFPWPRSIYNPLIEYCVEGGAKAVVFDILFNNTSPYGEEVDASFAGAMKSAEIITLAAAFTDASNGVTKKLDSRFSLKAKGAPPHSIKKNGVSPPLPLILRGAKNIGSVTARPDEDGVYRRAMPFVLYNDRLYPSLFTAPLFSDKTKVTYSEGGLLLDKTFVPLDSTGSMMINYHAERGTYKSFSAASVIISALQENEGKKTDVSKEVFKDAYVIVGYTAPGLYDLKPTPLSSLSPGMEAHAAALDNLLNGDFMTDASMAVNFAIALLLGFLAVACVVYPGSPLTSAVSTVLIYTLLFATASALFSAGYLVDFLAAGATPLFALILGGVYRYQSEGKRRRYIQKAFGYYVSAKVVKQIMADPERLSLGGEKREITIFFSDLAGFTTLSEKLSAHDLVEVLNEYTTMMSDVITSHDGTLDKYIGDAVMAFWGAPTDEPNQATLAVGAALDSLKRLKQFEKEHFAGDTDHVGETKKSSATKLSMRIGINTGECVVGNMGSQDRFDYTAIGDPVNQAARFEGLGKAYGVNILVSEKTMEMTGSAFFVRKIDFIKVKGKNLPVTVYEVLSVAGEESDTDRRKKEEYEKAFDAYINRRWGEACSICEKLIKSLDDGPAKTLMERSDGYKKAPPPNDWDGSFAHTTK